KETTNKFYGTKITPTIFQKNLRIDDLSEPLDPKGNNVTLINLQAPMLYINTNDNTDINIIDCKFQGIEVIEEDL
ncbi:MAG: hypothetical protein ACRC41_06730, partial [Sarcina sp.]